MKEWIKREMMSLLETDPNSFFILLEFIMKEIIKDYTIRDIKDNNTL